MWTEDITRKSTRTGNSWLRFASLHHFSKPFLSLLFRRWYDSPRQVKYTDPCSLISEPFLFTSKLSELTHRMKQVISSVIMLIFVDY
jgi:hypothetical protein